jgi:hypothetical protein
MCPLEGRLGVWGYADLCIRGDYDPVRGGTSALVIGFAGLVAVWFVIDARAKARCREDDSPGASLPSKKARSCWDRRIISRSLDQRTIVWPTQKDSSTISVSTVAGIDTALEVV